MAAIISCESVCDGYDVQVQRSDDSPHTFHFLTMPEDVQAAVDQADVELTAAEAILPDMEM